MNEKFDAGNEQSNAPQDADQDAGHNADELAGDEVEESRADTDSRRRVWFVGLLVVALVAVGGAGAYWLLPILTQASETSPEKTFLDAADTRDSKPSASESPSQKSWQEDEALVARLNEIGARLRRIEGASPASTLESANVWLQAAQQNLTRPGGARFALVAARVAATLLEQANAPRARLALSDLRHWIAQLETLDASTRQAFDAVHAILVWMDDSLQTDIRKSQADSPDAPQVAVAPQTDSPDKLQTVTEPQEPQESLWDLGMSLVGNLLSEVFQVQRDEEVFSAAWQAIIVRRALVVAQAALLERDNATWRMAMRHALSAARQLPLSELTGKIESAQAIEVAFADERIGAQLSEIISALRTAERGAE